MRSMSTLAAAMALAACAGAMADGVPIEHAPREPEPPKGERRFKNQSKKMLYNMSTRRGAIEGLQWAEHRDTVAAQKGFTTKQIENLRRSWLAVPARERKPWVEFLQHHKLPK